jgi:hypothetical protein
MVSSRTDIAKRENPPSVIIIHAVNTAIARLTLSTFDDITGLVQSRLVLESVASVIITSAIV